jgi:hypothetical protein
MLRFNSVMDVEVVVGEIVVLVVVVVVLADAVANAVVVADALVDDSLGCGWDMLLYFLSLPVGGCDGGWRGFCFGK